MNKWYLSPKSEFQGIENQFWAGIITESGEKSRALLDLLSWTGFGQGLGPYIFWGWEQYDLEHEILKANLETLNMPH